ncbi:Tkl protein kinase [Globisporangium polare]
MGDARIVRYLIEKDVRLDPLPYAGATTDMAPLAIACLHGHMEIAELLLASGAHINGVSLIDTSLSPLLDTVRHGRVEMVQWLVDNGARVDILDKNGEMPILSAASQGRRRIVDVLLAAIPSDAASARDTYYSLMRTESASSGSFDVLKHLVEHGVGKFDSHDGKRADILGAAVRSQRVEMVRYILKKREFERGESMTTSLFVAIYARRSDIAELLIAHGADFYDLRSTFGESSVHFAIKGGMVSTLEVMFRCELDIGHLMPDHQGRTVMHAIAEYGDVRMLALVKRMFGDTLDLNACTSFGDQTPFQLACENGRADAVEFLLAEYPSGSFDINFCNSFHNTALKLAASRGHLDIVIRLLHAGALVETGGAGYSALAAAAGAGHFEVVELLCGHGASVNEGSVLHSVARGGHAPMLEYLIEKWHASMVYRTRDAELSLLDVAVPHPHLVRALLSYSGAELESDLQQSSSALCRAVLRGNFEAVQLLVRYGANVNAPFTSTQDDGQRDLELTPLTAAALAGDLGVVAYLCENGADLELATDQNETVLYLAVARGLVNWSRTCSQSTAWEWNTEQQWGSVQWRSQNATKRSQSGPEGCRPESCSCWKAMERGLRGSSFTRSTTRRGCWKLQAYATGRQRMLAQFVDGVVKQYW